MTDVHKLLQTTQCHECGEHDLEWFTSLHGSDGVQDGRHKLNEIRVMIVLGCNYCSETLAVVSADKFLAAFKGE